MEEQLEAVRAILKKQNLSQFAKETQVKRAVLYDFLAGKNIRTDHFLKILTGLGGKIELLNEARFHLEKVPFDQRKKLEFLRLLDLIVEKYDPEKIIIFGSQATGHWDRDSDFDLAIIDLHIKAAQGRLLPLSYERGIRITYDYFVMTSEQLASDKSINSVEYAVKTEGHTIYERNKPPPKSQR